VGLPAQRGDNAAPAATWRYWPDMAMRPERNGIEKMPAEYVDAFFKFSADRDLGESRVLPTVGQVTGSNPVPSDGGRAHAAAFGEPGAGP
jgi:hypothetical protein